VGPILLVPVVACAWLAVPAQSDPRAACADVKSCREAALEAASRQDYETFHDLAWRAVQRGRRNDPDLMYLLARAQSLSGRPGDALVMIRRLSEMGVATDAATDDDFRRVRALPGWADVEGLLARLSAKGEAPEPAETERRPEAPPARRETASRAPDAPAAPPAPPPKAEPDAGPPPPSRAVAAPTPIVGAGGEDALRLAEALHDPVGLAYDGVSRRFIVGDRRLNKLIVVDEVFNRTTNMVAASSAGFFGLTGFEIDRRRGDLWVANSSPKGGASLHKLQLISGRVLYSVALPDDFGPADFHDIAVTPAGALLVLDPAGKRLFRLPPGARSFDPPLALLIEEPTSLAAAGEHIAYVASAARVVRVDLRDGTAAQLSTAREIRLEGLNRIWHSDGHLLALQEDPTGGTRIVRVRLDAHGVRALRVEVLDQGAGIVNPTVSTLGPRDVYYVTEQDGRHVVRRVPVR
jgi:hypothetical protein